MLQNVTLCSNSTTRYGNSFHLHGSRIETVASPRILYCLCHSVLLQFLGQIIIDEFQSKDKTKSELKSITDKKSQEIPEVLKEIIIFKDYQVIQCNGLLYKLEGKAIFYISNITLTAIG